MVSKAINKEDEMKNCKACGEPIQGNNKHRNHCHKCKIEYPHKPAKALAGGGDGKTFKRKEVIKCVSD